MGETLFVIPARGRSKRLPRKNLLPLGGKPLIVWTIEAALESAIPGLVCVSTDDEEIAEISKKAGAAVPFIRPAELATDTASSVDVVAHAYEYCCSGARGNFETITLLQPTSPLRDAEDIRAAFHLFYEKEAENVVSICPVAHSPLWANVLSPDRSLRGFIREDIKGKRSQDLPTYYRLNGAIYICAAKRFLAKQSLLFEDKSFAYIMTMEHSLDIDTTLDFRIAEVMLAELNGTN